MDVYSGLNPYFGDLHSHCGISYGFGTLKEAFQNARERLDFCSVTGHAFWPDMPAPTEHNQPIIDFHLKGFAKLKRLWPQVLKECAEASEEGQFLTFPGYEMHSMSDGDYTVVYRDFSTPIVYAHSLAELKTSLLHQKEEQGHDFLAFPHHIAYRRGTRGINWDSFDPRFSPLVEIISMHGCSEGGPFARPFLFVMGPADGEGTMQYGLEKGYIFGVLGNTDHHSAHPGTYGRGLTGVWAESLTRQAVWEALNARRTYALTGDRIRLAYSLNDAPMGSVLAPTPSRELNITVRATAAIDCVDIIRNNELIKRFSACDVPQQDPGDSVRTHVYLELGWGHPRHSVHWDVDVRLSTGRIVSVEPRFRGRETLSPLEHNGGTTDTLYYSRCTSVSERSVHLVTETQGNPNQVTNTSQGICLEVEMPLQGKILLDCNGKKEAVLLEQLLKRAFTGSLIDDLESPAWRLHRAPLPWESCWRLSYSEQRDERDVYSARVRQQNDQWAWSSPIFVQT